MSATNDGGPAFPTKREAHDPRTIGWSMQEGMTLRDWFAGMALQGEVANPSAKLFEADSITFDDLAGDCYRIADAMLAARMEAR